MAKSTPKTDPPGQPIHDIKLSFLDEKNPDAEPPISDAQGSGTPDGVGGP
jgi:hypothetical protein